MTGGAVGLHPANAQCGPGIVGTSAGIDPCEPRSAGYTPISTLWAVSTQVYSVLASAQLPGEIQAVPTNQLRHMVRGRTAYLWPREGLETGERPIVLEVEEVVADLLFDEAVGCGGSDR
jgi:hypothetical protein